jgi:Tol biopolymer transport system component
MLDPKRWPEAESLLDRALAEPPDRRSAFLAREVSDPALAEELALVIAEADRPDDFLAPGGAVSGPLFAAFAAADGDVDQKVDVLVEERRALSEGQTLGPYRVDQPIGRGGMGEVFRARDLRLGRDVALKVLPSGMTVDAIRRARVTREARTLAALSHPNIAAIHDLYEEPPVVALVLELIEGPTLAERLTRGPLPLDTTMAIARQIVDAIAAAHERGIVHRDLKPSNIKVTHDGFVKILDFGLARVVSQGNEDEERTLTPSITTAVHGPGVVMGTAAYMSPEQASGRPVDHRADIWAFGCILFEMLAGRRAFEGDTAGQVLARVIEREPDFALLPASTPPSLVRLVRRCLRKDPSRRLGFIGDARLDLDDQEMAADAALEASQAVATGAVEAMEVRRGGINRSLRVAVGTVLALLVGVAVGALVMRWRAQPAVAGVARLAVPLPAGQEVIIGQLPALARSRDGRMLVYRARRDGVMRLFVRALDDAQPRPLAGTEGVEGHAVSPDGRSVAFVRDGRLFRLAIAGGTPVPICDAPGGATLDWGAGNAIVFSTGTNRHLMRVDASSGGAAVPVTVTTLDATRGDTAHATPSLSPDARTVAFTIAGRDGFRLAIAPVAGGDVRILGDGRQPRFLSDDLLLFARQQSVWAVKIDVGSGRFVGDAVQVLDGVAQAGVNGYVHLAPASDGSLVYLGQAAPDRGQRLVWLDRGGAEVATEYEGRGVTRFAIAPDATRLAFSSSEGAGRDVWVFDRARRTRGRLTLDPDVDTAPVWSPDSRRIAYRSDRRGGGLFIRAADGADEERRLTSAEGLYHTPYTFTPDGRRLLFVEFRDYKQQDVLSVRLDGSGSGSGPGRIEPVLTGPAAELRPALSPDGRWLAYQSDESGRFEVYVRPFPDVQRAKVQVSADGGTSPVWRADGRELFFASAGTLIAVDVPAAGSSANTSARGSNGASASSRNASDAAAAPAGDDAAFSFGALRRLFAIGGADDRLGPLFDIQPDGARVLVLRDAAGGGEPLTVHLVQGWRAIVQQAVEQATGDAREPRR